MIARLRYVQRFRDRHGRVRLYLRRRGQKPIPLPAEDDPSFLKAYQAALAEAAPAPKANRVEDGSVEAVVGSFRTSSAYINLRASTQSVYDRILTDLCRRHGTKPFALMRPIDVQKEVTAAAETPAAANHRLRTLRALARHAVKIKVRPDDPTIGVERLKEKGEGAQTWTDADIAAYEARWPIGTKPRLALALLLYTGQRRSDVVRIGPQHDRNGEITIKQLKTDTELVIPKHPELAAAIDAMTEVGVRTYLVTDAGIAFTANGFYMRFKAWVSTAGLPSGRSPHGLRKAAARRLAEAGATEHQIASITGHKSLAEIQRYTKAVSQARLARSAVVMLGSPTSVTD